MSGPGRKDVNEPDLGLCEACSEPCEFETWGDARVAGWVHETGHDGLGHMLCDLCAKDGGP